ncbi:phage portal protein family protein [Camelimonas lactis]|uniref:Phage gp29-like protein n=1 Tax=Camelimonas lactis TaxID=659006 RepID=A0A4R2GWK5_9HYPH|nr:DUF935 family protein [Camelimonas lactis]TCO15193.1 phage gp29-like protein [Camelimonas lactis]
MSKKPRRKAVVNMAEAQEPRKNLPAASRALFAHARNDINIPHYSGALRPTDDVLIQRGKGIELYREVLRDGRAFTTLQKRKRALIAREWTVKAASEEAVDMRAAELVDRIFTRLPFDQITLNMLDATLMGFSVQDTVWDRDGFEIVPTKIQKIDQTRVVFDIDWKPRLLTRQHMLDGEPWPERKAIVHRFDQDDASDPYGFGLGRILFWHTLFKREGVAFWLKALERFAMPLPVAKYPVGTLPADQNRLLDALAGAIAGGAMAVPAGTEVMFAQAALSGTLTHESWCRYWDEQTAETVLGETLTTNVGGNGSRAAAEVHRDTKDELIDGDADLVSATLQDSVVRWICEYNIPDAHPPSIQRLRPSNVKAEEEAKTARAQRRAADINTLFKMQSNGFAPENMAEALTEIMERPIVVCTPVPPPSGSKPNAGSPSFAGPDQRPLLDQLIDASAPMRAAWIERIREAMDDLIARGGSLADLPDALLEIYPDLDTAELGALLGDAFALADLQGRASVIDDIGDGDAP